MKRLHAVTPTLLMFCSLSCSGRALTDRQDAANVEPVYIPGTRRIEAITEGDPAPFDGFVVPPAVMAEIGPCLSDVIDD